VELISSPHGDTERSLGYDNCISDWVAPFMPIRFRLMGFGLQSFGIVFLVIQRLLLRPHPKLVYPFLNFASPPCLIPLRTGRAGDCMECFRNQTTSTRIQQLWSVYGEC
jgi:hypothetical protein